MVTVEEPTTADPTLARPSWRRRRKSQTPRLTTKQRLFIVAVAAGLNQTDAARQAGYKDSPSLPSIASLLAAKPAVKAEIDRARSLVLAAKTWSLEWWRNELADAHAAAVTAGDLPSRLRALELAGRHLGALESHVDQANAERALRLTELLTMAMAAQMAAPLAAALPVTVEGQVRAMFPNAVSQPADDAPPQ